MSRRHRGRRKPSPKRLEVEKTVARIGETLLHIRDERLYEADGYESFETYCRERWQFGPQQLEPLIAAAERSRRVETRD